MNRPRPALYLPPKLPALYLQTMPRRAICGLGAIALAIGTEASLLIMQGVAVMARIVWIFSAMAFVTGGFLSIVLWCQGRTDDAWFLVPPTGMALVLMTVARIVQNACIRYRLQHLAY